MEDKYDDQAATQSQPAPGSSPSEVDQNNHQDLTGSKGTGAHESENFAPSKEDQNRYPDSDESQGIEPCEGDSPKIPRGLAGDKVRLKIAAQNVRNELSGIKESIDTLLGWTSRNDEEKTG